MIDFENADVMKLRHVDEKHFQKMLEPILIDDERIVAAFQTVRDGVVFTNKRIIAINVQGVTGKKKDFTSLPYKKIQVFSVESSGVFDIESEMDLWFSGLGRLKFEFIANANIAEICRTISQYVL